MTKEYWVHVIGPLASVRFDHIHVNVTKDTNDAVLAKRSRRLSFNCRNTQPTRRFSFRGPAGPLRHLRLALPGRRPRGAGLPFGRTHPAPALLRLLLHRRVGGPKRHHHENRSRGSRSCVYMVTERTPCLHHALVVFRRAFTERARSKLTRHRSVIEGKKLALEA